VTTTGGLTVGGNLQVTGTTTTISTENLSIADNMFFLNQVESDGSPTIIADVGWAANVNDDGVYTHVGMFRDATDNTFKVFNEYALEPDSALEIDTGHASFKLAPFAALTYTGKYLGADSDIDARLSGGTGITYSSGVISTNDAQIVHDNLSGFVANEHVDHSSVTITAGSGLTGGGDITASRTLNIGQGTGITVAADAISTNDAQIVHDNLSGFVANEHIDHSTVSITAGSGLTGGGTIAATRTLNIGQGTGITVSADAISTNDAQIVHDNLSGFVANEHIDHSTVSITAGSGLTGGGTIAATRTLNIGAGTYIIVNADDIAVDATSANTASKVVARDGSGNFSAGTITAALSGNASTATEATNVTVVANNSTDETTYITFVDGATGTQGIETDTGLTYNPSTNVLTTTTFSGALSGNATTATTLQTARTIAISGDITGTATSFNGGANISISSAITAGVIVDADINASAGIVDTKLNTISTAGKVSNTATTATSANTGSAIVARDGSGNFSAGTITASLTGTASLATEVTATANNSTDETTYITFVDGATGSQGIETDTGLTYNPSTNTLTTTTFSGALSGNATTATTLQTARTIGGVSFDGSANIDLPGVNTAGNQNTSGTAAIATEVTISANNTNDETVYLTFVDGATGTQGLETDTGLTYNPSTGVLGSVDFNSTSDESLKENIKTIESAADKVSKLRGVNFNWKDTDRYAMGVIAQEVEKVIPEVVNEIDGIKKVSYGSMVGLLIEAIKDLQQQVNDLKS
jgi:hypothetical protein